MKLTSDKKLQKIFQDAYHIKRVLISCETVEQLQNTNSWINCIFEKWSFLFQDIAVSTYYRYYKDIVTTVIEELHYCYNERDEFFNNKEKEENEKKKRIVVTGFQ